MKFFDELGATVESRWRDRGYDEQAFPEIAERALLQLPPNRHVTPLDVATWAQSTPTMPRQVGDGTFGQPPLTVHTASRFFIEVIFWLDGTTAIHQHAFAGAFHVLDGSSIHARYGFETGRRVNAHCLFGRVELRDVEYLETGSTRPIAPGKSLIHSLFHLDRPSTSVVVRTYHDDEAGPQYRYLKPCLAAASVPFAEPLKRRLATVNMMRQIRHPQASKLCADFVAGADLHEATLILEDLFGKHQDWDEFCGLVELVGKRHGDVWHELLEVFAERRRQQAITSRRSQIQSTEHRFFLALLLNLPSRKTIFDLMRRRFPEREPASAIMSWISEIADLPGSDPSDPNVLGVPLNDAALAVMGGLVSGLTGDRLKARLLEEFEPADVEALAPEIEDLSNALKSSDFFRPLFVD